LKASQISSSGPYSFLFKGPFGFGKTLAAASFAIEGPVYLSYWDKKSPIELTTFFSEKRFGSLGKKILDNIEYDVYDSSNAGEYLNKIIGFLDDCRYFAVINDSITFMTSSAVNWSLNFGKNQRVMKKMKDVIPSFDEYKVETSLVSQCIDLSRKLPCHVIWTAHPLAGIAVSGSGASITVSKTNPIVSYGSKVASLVPGSFTEIYHFSQQSDYSAGKSSKKYVVSTEAIGDEFAKSPLLGDYIKEFDITDKLFYPVWKDLLDKSRGIEPKTDVIVPGNTGEIINPFAEKGGWKV
jgi:hypothetical protein